MDKTLQDPANVSVSGVLAVLPTAWGLFVRHNPHSPKHHGPHQSESTDADPDESAQRPSPPPPRSTPGKGPGVMSVLHAGEPGRLVPRQPVRRQMAALARRGVCGGRRRFLPRPRHLRGRVFAWLPFRVRGAPCDRTDPERPVRESARSAEPLKHRQLPQPKAPKERGSALILPGTDAWGRELSSPSQPENHSAEGDHPWPFRQRPRQRHPHGAVNGE